MTNPNIVNTASVTATTSVQEVTTVAAITKDTGIYLEEGNSLRCTAGENAAIHGICSYEIISEST